MNTSVARKVSETARSLRELASLIKIKLKEAKEAGEEAMQPYWAEVGELLLEAKGQFDSADQFYEWSRRQFDIGETQTRIYVGLVSNKPIPGARRGQTLSDAIRAIGGSPRGSPRGGHREWAVPVDDIANRARREADRLRQQELTRQQEREAERQLALRLIDIGYKVLAKELHPDAGGSREAMTRLHAVRDRLKAHA